MTPTIRHATPADAPALAELAERTFIDAFGAMNRPDDLAQYLATAYGPAQQGREIADPETITLVVEGAADGREAGGADGAGRSRGVVGPRALIAYAQIRRGHAPACVTGPDPIELQRFYVSAEFHGRGVAQQLMARVFSEARATGARTLWLGVWERNPRGIAFYKKSGYADVGQHVFVVGNDPQTDRVLVRPLTD